MKAKLYKCDTPNLNGVVYPREELEKAVKNYNEYSNRLVTLEPYGSESPTEVDFDNVIGEAKLSMEGDYVSAEITLNNSSKAKLVEKQLNATVLPLATGILESDESKVCTDLAVVKVVVPTGEPGVGIEGADPELFKVERI